ncbi:NDP-sugar epimerase, includes UDP-GlcNAc-inverting 4,6-dehydratase FlaA1 and capsular polysaccharide biosynthesis protein EpsC [Singulisphaera sp. GP187]|uniref:polysaccharide biosynthesis protein n=1 Tax=Singulisphaera sp. GP187 TaxID=1882752 RepID=UPI00092A5ACF|nr:nucleoside-diphosphate sugar epimerase/dehydratase [Singulisphaera sp. GP187]SIO55428.1 NDP-sugar epimerase, includes UDP-GlcNAc-inverting 4,6-dehydratase FlaA1 and capsular polysaccharide biosynthesis protein EpsC [Singulisphaera sp. GP187]
MVPTSLHHSASPTVTSQTDQASGVASAFGREAVNGTQPIWSEREAGHELGRGTVWPQLTRLLHLLLRHRVPVLVVFHLLAFAGIYGLSYLIRFDGKIPASALALAWKTLPLVVALKLAVFLVMGSHRGWWQYASFADLIALFEAATFGMIAVLVTDMVFWTQFQIPRSIIVIDWAATLLIVGGIRGSTRLFRERYYPMLSTQSTKRVLVVGASESGVALARAIQSQASVGMQVVGFIDDDPRLLGRNLAGIKVVGRTEKVALLAARHKAGTVLVPTPTVSIPELRALVADCTAAELKIQVVPGFHALLDGSLSVRPRDVDIHDLLCREPIQLDGESIGRLIRGRVVLVTGAAGSIGSEICRQALAFRPERLVMLDHNENGLFFLERELAPVAAGSGTEIVIRVADITDAHRVRTQFERYRPALVFHAAAHKHVPMMEANPGEAVKNNIFGTRTVADEAVRAGVEAFVMISTDKAVNPTSVMGATKRLAEMYVQSLSSGSATRLVTVRFGNVLGSNGSVIPVFKQQIARGGPVTVTHPAMTRYFMTISEATQLVLQAAALGRGGEIFVLDMGEPVRVHDLARDLIRLSGLREGRDIEIVFSGLRPGEKLYEELYEDEETRLATPHPKIFSAQHRPCSPDRLKAQFESVARVVTGSSEDVIALLKQLVPGYGTPPGVELHLTSPEPAPSLQQQDHVVTSLGV